MLFIIDGIIGAGLVYAWDVWKEREKTKKAKFAKHLSMAISKDKQVSAQGEINLIEEVIEIYQDKSRKGQMMTLGADGKSPEEERLDKGLKVLQTSLLFSSIGAFIYAPATLLALPGLIYAPLPIFKRAIQSVKDRKLQIEVLDAIAIIGILGTGHFLLASVAATAYHISRKMLIKTENHSKKNLVNILGEQPRRVWILKGEAEVEIPFEQLQVGDILSVRTGEMIPVDGKVAMGTALVDQHTLTGESKPAEKTIGQDCFASTIIIEGHLFIGVEKAGEETVAAQIGAILQNSINYKKELSNKGKRLADASVLPTLIFGAASLPLVGVVGAATILNASFGYSLRTVSPIMMLNYLTIASKEGILIKDGRSLERLKNIDAVVFDKTGTLTLNQPYVAKIYPLKGLSEDQLLQYAAAAEYRQKHPVALAILAAAAARDLTPLIPGPTKYEIGFGIETQIEGKTHRIGSAKFMEREGVTIPEHIKEKANDAQLNGFSFVYLAIEDNLEGAIELHPTIRPEAHAVIQEIKSMGLECYIISGDNYYSTQYLAKQLKIEHFFAEVLPQDKAKLVNDLQNRQKKVCFIGDGINDAIALQQADVSVSLLGATTVATDTAQVVLMKENLHQLPLLFDIGEQFDDYMQRNVQWSVVPSLVTIGSVFLFNAGIATAVTSNFISLVGGGANSMHPVWRYQQAKNEGFSEEKVKGQSLPKKKNSALPSPIASLSKASHKE